MPERSPGTAGVGTPKGGGSRGNHRFTRARSASTNAWVNFLRAHSALTRALNSDLVNTHGLTINDYEVLLHLERADGNRLRRVDLAGRLLLTASGITRLVDGLEREGYVCKGTCDSDARVTYAVLTDEGHTKLRAASGTHLDEVETLFESHFSQQELEVLEGLLARLPGQDAGPDSCSAD